MGKLTYKKRLVENIDAIEIAHSQMMDILKEEIDLENINEDRWKAVAEGKGKAQEVADKLLIQLKEKENQLEDLKAPKEKKEEDEKEDEGLNGYLK